jgi:beta-glucosidase
MYYKAKKNIVSIAVLLSLSFGCSQDIYKNSRHSAEKRVEDLLPRLTLEEKVMLMQDRNRAIERLGMKEYNWWNEALHGVARAGNATVFPQPIGMAASFDSDLVFSVFTAVSDEARAKHAYFSAKGQFGRYQGLTMWTPTVNVFRDPRWGRGMESYGEDPYLNAVLGSEVVKGLQGPSDSNYDKLHACAKHFAVHSGPEWNRHSFDVSNISPRDLHETYLPAFKSLVKDANVRMVMCAYNRFEGDPCCGSDKLLVDILRNEWGYDGVIVADCNAIRDFFDENAHATHPDAATASAQAVLSGTDLDCGSSYKALVEGVSKGLITESDIDISVKRLLQSRFELGEMDALSKVDWSKIPYSVVCSPKHNALALEMARKSMVLLMNKNNTLPLKKGNLTVAVMGPNANDSLMQWGNYNGTPLQTVTILDGIKKALEPGDKLIYEKGCEWVDRTILNSAFNNCASDNGKGFTAQYWNNSNMEGIPVVTNQVTTPFQFCTSGATVFAPGVNLTDFSAAYTSVFTPTESGDVYLQFYINGITTLLIDGVEVRRYQTNHGSRKQEHKLKAEAGKSYRIEIQFSYHRPDAELNFNIGYKNEIDIQKSVAAVKDADVVVFVSGISPFLEGEEMGVSLPGFHRGDRTDIELPQVQKELIDALFHAGKKVILVNCSGSAISFSTEVDKCEAILQAWYPGQTGGTAVADILFGHYNPSGRLPVTFYKSVEQLPHFEDYNMANRTYRFIKDEPMFAFGHGLSYSTFSYGEAKLSATTIKENNPMELTVPLTNTSSIDGEEVIQVYLQKPNDDSGPSHTLRAFQRVFVRKGETVQVKFLLNAEQLEWWNSDAQRMKRTKGNYNLLVGGTSDANQLQKVAFEIK